MQPARCVYRRETNETLQGHQVYSATLFFFISTHCANKTDKLGTKTKVGLNRPINNPIKDDQSHAPSPKIGV